MSSTSINSTSRELRAGGGLCGTVRVPGDKSISHRALLFGAIAEGSTTIEGLLPAEDPLSTAACLRAMGATISPIRAGEIVHVEGVGLDGLQEPEEVLDCGNSGTTMRLMLGLLAGRHGRHFVLTGDKSLSRRPMNRVAQPLAMMGAAINGRSSGNFAPLAVSGKKLRGAVIGTPVASAQVKSALVLAALTAQGSTTVIEPAHSRDHTERMLRAFGANLEVVGEMGRHISVQPGSTLHGQTVVVPGDISSAAFWLVAGSLVPGAELLIENVGLNPTRTGILEVMESMEARIEVINQREVAGEPVGDLRVKQGPLKPFSINEEIMPRLVDEVPILAVAACFCDGESKITGASELRVKETDRLAVMTRQLTAMGADIDEHPDGLTIRGGRTLRGAALDSETDHRVAMSLAVAALLATGNSTLSRSEAAAVSYPTFWDELERLRR
ncbi:MAG: 3-phosphoshikimate 1-carboxyvinyltransferase [Prochlorococcus sp.]|nr:3-phosphoshikimate 1-carboxyvinyltransferase [Prochlorococcaceae cyanobacterium ETNP18_MAG_14]MDP6309742.1 3-phosphoshikimate 1-carboxyvinyltransferase [Prochlorococcaceae cyanobacterium ETNP14_MAG_4]HJM81109.1 3-phosphoshikimate 1-carboxyvinyltransferase [Prochlorococcaceae cyanobacterium Fu_MAG_72]